jgi:hypothetical protein
MSTVPSPAADWIAAVDFQAGPRHRRECAPCQDYGALRRLPGGIVLGAVADGAGSAPHSAKGARWAVQHVLRHLGAVFRTDASGTHRDIEQTLRAALAATRGAIGDRAARNGLLVEDIACTLIVFVAAPDWLAAAQIGDGFIVARLDGDAYELLLAPLHGEYVNETVFLTAPDGLDSARLTLRRTPARFICAATDGLESVSLRSADAAPHAGFFRPLEQFLSTAEDERMVRRSIREFLRSERLAARSDDDKTLLLCGRRDVTPA